MGIFRCNKLSSQKGQTIIEILVALSVASLVVSAIIVAVISSLSGAQYTKNQNQATQYAQQGMEVARQLRDSSYQTFSSLTGTYCLDLTCKLDGSAPACSQSSPCAPNINGIFVRQITFTQKSASCSSNGASPIPDPSTYPALVQISVNWSDGKCPSTNLYCHSVILTDCLSQNNTVPLP